MKKPALYCINLILVMLVTGVFWGTWFTLTRSLDNVNISYLRGGFFDQIGIPPGTIIAYINGKAVASPKDIESSLMAAGNSRIQILAIAPDGSRVAFNFSLGA